MAVLGSVDAVSTSVLEDVAVRLGVTVQHRSVDAGVVAARTAEWLRTDVISQVILEVMLEFGHERTFRTNQHSVTSDVHTTVDPELLLYHKHEYPTHYCFGAADVTHCKLQRTYVCDQPARSA